MVPDFALIAEISLFSYGFNEARKLAQKIVSTFRLANEQLSAQHQYVCLLQQFAECFSYDFGMRAVKAVLMTASSLKRSSSSQGNQKEFGTTFTQEDLNTTPEEGLILKALYDCNVPKLLSEDIPLFKGIIGDLFSGISEHKSNNEIVKTALENAAVGMGLQPVEIFWEKCLQIWETIKVFNSICVVTFERFGMG
jgi:dynein heavy chain